MAVAVTVAAFLLLAFRHDLAPDVYGDGLGFFLISKSIALGHGLTSYGGPPGTFFYDPPLFMLVEAIPIKLLGLASRDLFSALYTVRLINIGAGALTAALLFVLGMRLRNFWTGLFISILFAIDPFVLRNVRRNFLEPSVMLLVVLAMLLLHRHGEGLTRRAAITLGVIFGAMLLVKEVSFYFLAVPLMFLLLGNPRAYRRVVPPVVASWAIALGIYGLYPAWALLSGNWTELVARKGSQLARLTGQVQHTGGYHDSTHPSLLQTLEAQLPRYGPSYFFVILGGILALYLLLHSRKDVGARLLASWGLVDGAFFVGLYLKGGALNDQYFYLLLVAMTPVIGYSVAVLVSTARSTSRRPSLAAIPLDFPNPRRVLPTATLMLCCGLTGALLYNAWLYYRYDATGIDNGYQQLTQYVEQHVSPGTTISIASDSDAYLFPAYPTELTRDHEAIKTKGIHYFILNSRIAAGGFNGMTPEFYAWVASNAVEKFGIDEDSFGHLGLYYMS
jgi:hypothetical protein